LGQDFQATLWIGLDSIHELMDWIGLGQQKWTHVQLWFTEPQHWQRQRNVTELTRYIWTACYSAIPQTHFLQYYAIIFQNICKSWSSN